MLDPPVLPVTSQSPYCDAYRDHEARPVLVAVLKRSARAWLTLVRLRMMRTRHATPPCHHLPTVSDSMCVGLDWTGFEGGGTGHSGEFSGWSPGLSGL